jgi:uncharacterized YccA/Bax inhibitor family protein
VSAGQLLGIEILDHVILNLQYPGIVANAIGLTFGILVALLLAYRSGLIRATENFKLGVFAATGGMFPDVEA